MKFLWFHRMPHTRFPANFAERRDSVWGEVDSGLPGPHVAHAFRHEFVGDAAWEVQRMRCQEASARSIWGGFDAVVPARHAERSGRGIAGLAEIQRIGGSGFPAELDHPDRVARAITDLPD